jgi:hypothetical protein
MNTMKKLSGIALASAAATLLLAGCGGDSTKTAAKVESAPAEATKVAEVKCSGINSCKGTGACASATHACAGQNSCKGQGWIKASKEDCDAKGGTVVSG